MKTNSSVLIKVLCTFTCVWIGTIPCFGQMGEPEVLIVSGRSADEFGFPGDRIAFMYHFSISPDGRWWVGEMELDDTLDALVCRGFSAETPQLIWVEHDPVPGYAGEEFRTIFDDRPLAIDSLGRVVGLARRNLVGVNRPLVFKFDGQELTVVATEDQDIPVLPFQYGNLLHSPNVTENGDAAFVAENIAGANVTEDEVVLTANGLQFGQQKGNTTYDGLFLQSFVDEMYFANQTTFLFDAGLRDAVPGTGRVVIFGEKGTDGKIVLRETRQILPCPTVR